MTATALPTPPCPGNSPQKGQCATNTPRERSHAPGVPGSREDVGPQNGGSTRPDKVTDADRMTGRAQRVGSLGTHSDRWVAGHRPAHVTGAPRRGEQIPYRASSPRVTKRLGVGPGICGRRRRAHHRGGPLHHLAVGTAGGNCPRLVDSSSAARRSAPKQCATDTPGLC